MILLVKLIGAFYTKHYALAHLCFAQKHWWNWPPDEQIAPVLRKDYNCDVIFGKPFIFKVCVLVCLVLACVGGDGHPLSFGSESNEFLGKGIVVGYSIIVPAVLFTYILGANLTILVKSFKKNKKLY